MTNLADQAQHIMPTQWTWLQQRGWTIKPTNIPTGTARANNRTKTIEVKPAVYHTPGRRHTQYVLRHEIWHALHWETTQWNTDLLTKGLGITHRAALEVIADAACLHTQPNPTMRRWVHASVIWHGRIGSRYKWTHLTNPLTTTTLTHIKNTITATP